MTLSINYNIYNTNDNTLILLGKINVFCINT